MQKKSVPNVAVVRLRLFSYTKAAGVRTLYPLRVSTVRENHLNLFSFKPAHLFNGSFMTSWFPSDSRRFYCNRRKSSKFFASVHVWLSVHQFVFSSFSCHTSFSETGEKGGDWFHGSGSSSEPPHCWVSPRRVAVHTPGPAPDLRGEVPRHRGGRGPADAPVHSRERMAPQPPKHQQVGVSRSL